MLISLINRNLNKLTQLKNLNNLKLINFNYNFKRNFSISKVTLLSNENSYRSTSEHKRKLQNAIWYSTSAIILMIGVTYTSVPLYKLFCESQGFDINKRVSESSDEELKQRLQNLKKNEERVIKVKFMANKSTDLLWDFEPSQYEVNLAIGETALAFYKAKNLTQRPIIGIATYNILPFEASLYFNKIQCFCFEEQRLEPNEEVDMPVFFYIDNDYANDPLLHKIDTICLSYTFFESKGGVDLENELPKIPKKFLQ